MSIMDRMRGQDARDKFTKSGKSGLLLPREKVMEEADEEERARAKRREKRRATSLQATANAVMTTVGKSTLLRLYDEHLSAGGPEGADEFMEVLAFMVERMESAGMLTERIKEARRRSKLDSSAPKDQGPLGDVMGVDMDEILAIAEGRTYTGGVEPESGIITEDDGSLDPDDPIFELMSDWKD